MARASSANRRTPATGGLGPPSALGIGQLTLVEHALCPLNSRVSLVENMVHNAVFLFTDGKSQRRHGRAQVVCPAGLSPADEFYLWGLLAITLSEPEPDAEFCATPHYCLRRLGVIDQFARRGGRQYGQFLQAIERLSLVRYRNDNFYDPTRYGQSALTSGPSDAWCEVIRPDCCRNGPTSLWRQSSGTVGGFSNAARRRTSSTTSAMQRLASVRRPTGGINFASPNIRWRDDRPDRLHPIVRTCPRRRPRFFNRPRETAQRR